MIRVAILEYEKETKDIAFTLSKIFQHEDWLFRHFNKASDLARCMKEETYQLFVFDEMFKTPRLDSVFVHDNPNALFIYVCKDPNEIRGNDERSRMLYISKENPSNDIQLQSNVILSQCMQSNVYELIYDGVHVNIAYEDIYYLEKNGKFVYFYTKKGKFHKRESIGALEEVFAPYGFLRVHVSYIVNPKHIVSWYKDEVELINHVRVPLSRSKKRKIAQEK